MKKKVPCIMLIDDNPHDNFYHERVIRNGGYSDNVVIKESGLDALEYLVNVEDKNYSRPTIIFLDINMPKMNGWEFLAAYEKLKPDLKSTYVMVMLTTSDSPDDMEQAEEIKTVSGFKTKPLSPDLLEKILDKII